MNIEMTGDFLHPAGAADPKALGLMALNASRDASREGRWEEVLQRVDEVQHLWMRDDLRRFAPYEAGIVKVEALFRLGRAMEAVSWLSDMAIWYGERHDIWWWRAKLAYFRSDFPAALDAIEDALLSLPLEEKLGNDYFELCALKSGCLVALGRTDEARAFLHCASRGAERRRWWLQPFRRAVDSPRALREFRDLLTPHFATKNVFTAMALFEYSWAARNLNNYGEAIAAMSRRYVVGVKYLNDFGDSSKSVKGQWSAQARVALHDTKEDLSALGVELFLISGTLLGCVRENDILGHDKDIDVGVMEPVDLGRLARHLSQTGRFSIGPWIHERMLQVKHANGVQVDIFVHWRRGDQIHHEGQKSGWWNTAFRLVRREFLGGSYLVPDNVDRYLTENYGNWRVPSKDFETFVDTPNMYVVNEPEMVWHYYRRLYDYYIRGKVVLYKKVWSALSHLRQPSVEMQQVYAESLRAIRKEKEARKREHAAQGE